MAGRPSGPKVRCGNTWTEARYQSFIKGNLRRATQKWAPIQQCLKNARIERGLYFCAECKREVTATIKDETTGKRIKNVHVDHIIPVVDPNVGFEGWDSYIERLFCEIGNLQVLCNDCHKIKTDEEKEIAHERRYGSEED